MNYQYRLVPVEALTAKVAAQRARLRQEAGIAETFHFRRPTERPFLAHERGRVSTLNIVAYCYNDARVTR